MIKTKMEKENARAPRPHEHTRAHERRDDDKRQERAGAVA